MGKFVLVVGGVRSGKSDYAVQHATDSGCDVVFVATAIAFDDEMKRRIDLHQKTRPKEWELLEEPKELASAVDKLTQLYEEPKVILIDCLGLFVTNLLLDDISDDAMHMRVDRLTRAIEQSHHMIIVVSNDVGSGVVPEHRLARRFRDAVGRANQVMARSADEVIMMQCGIPVMIKGGSKV